MPSQRKNEQNEQHIVKIPLTQGKVALIDAQDYSRVAGHKWLAVRRSRTYYAMRSLDRGGRRSTIYMHRQILNPLPFISVDHIDGNGLNNTRDNLRVCTLGENLYNQQVPTNNQSGFKGVAWAAHAAKWRAKIMHRGRQIHLGYFDDLVEAAHAYNAAALKYHGSFACPNAISEKEVEQVSKKENR